MQILMIIIVSFSYGGVSVDHIPFNSMETCIEAKAKIEAKKSGLEYKAIECVVQ